MRKRRLHGTKVQRQDGEQGVVTNVASHCGAPMVNVTWPDRTSNWYPWPSAELTVVDPNAVPQ